MTSPELLPTVVFITHDAAGVAGVSERLGAYCRASTKSVASLKDALRHLDSSSHRARSVPNVLVIDLSSLAMEPGKLQHRIGELKEQGRLIVIGGLASSAPIPSFVYPVHVDVLIRLPFFEDELARLIGTELARRTTHQYADWAFGVLNSVGVCVVVLDDDQNITWVNKAGTALLGVTLDVLIGKKITSLLHRAPGKDFDKALLKDIYTLQDNTAVCIGELELRCKPGRTTTVQCMASRNIQGGPHGEVTLLLRDITAEKDLHDEQLLSAKVFDYSGEAIMITDEEDRILKVNKAFTTVTGYPANEVIGRKPSFLSAGREKADFHTALWKEVHEAGHWKGEVWNRRRDGELYAVWLAISAVRNTAGDVNHYISIFTDVTERKVRDERHEHLANHDILTGLPNRTLLADRFERIVARQPRDPASVALLFIDLDGFKSINDTLGHGVGDELLCEVAQRLVGSVRASDTVSRHGGDEFVCLVSELDSPEAASKISETILAALRRPVEVAGHTLELTASVGIAVLPEAGLSLDELMARADDAMYQAKRTGRNRYQIAGDHY